MILVSSGLLEYIYIFMKGWLDVVSCLWKDGFR